MYLSRDAAPAKAVPPMISGASPALMCSSRWTDGAAVVFVLLVELWVGANRRLARKESPQNTNQQEEEDNTSRDGDGDQMTTPVAKKAGENS